MNVTPLLSDDPEEYRRPLLDLLRRNDELLHQAEGAQKQAENKQRGIDALEHRNR